MKNIDGINSYMRVAREQSDPFFPNPVKLPVARFAIDENDIIAQMRATHSRNFSQMSTFTATANTCAIRLGELVTTTLHVNLQKDTGSDLGRYRVTGITHRVNADGIYQNEFTGVAGLTEAMPLPHVQPAQAFPEPATVTDNADPKNQGRVKVRFFWMAEGENSGWLRVQNQNAGFSDNPSKAHGFLFIPSVDDQVMVAYELGDPSRPFVSGSLFHRDNAQGIPEVGTLSAIVSPGGHTIEFFDKEGEEELRILDKARECMIVLSSKGEGIKIIATNDLTLQGKNVIITAEENITIGAQQNVNIAAEADISAVAKGNLALQSDGDTTLNSSGALALESASDATISAMNAIIEGSSCAELNGAQTKLTGSAIAEVSGGIVKIN